MVLKLIFNDFFYNFVIVSFYNFTMGCPFYDFWALFDNFNSIPFGFFHYFQNFQRFVIILWTMVFSSLPSMHLISAIFKIPNLLFRPLLIIFLQI